LTNGVTLNKEPKYWNLPFGGLVGGAAIGGISALAKGVLWGFGGGSIGFIVGSIIARGWWNGSLQRFVYWNFGCSKLLLSSNVPQSHIRVLM